MKRLTLFILAMVLFILGCEETTIYETDPRLFNDAYHGSITGKVLQKESAALVIVGQVNPVDTVALNTDDGSFIIENLPLGNYDLQIVAENFRIYKQCNVLVTGAGTTYLGEIELSTVPDLVSMHYPDKNSEIIFNNRYSRLTISISFALPMDRQSVEEAFSTYPPTEGRFNWENYSAHTQNIHFPTYSSPYSDPDLGATITTYSKINSFSYIISQKDSYVDTTYSITLSTIAKDTMGNHLRFPLKFSFKTIQSSSTQNGILTTPEHGDMYVSPISYDGISISFPKNMNKSSVENALKINPLGDIIYLWSAGNKLTIYTGGVFLADTEYRIDIDSTAMDLDQIQMGAPFSFSFKTAPVRITNTSPRNGQIFVDLDEYIELQFNTYVSKSSVQNSFTITPAISGTFVYGRYYDSNKTVIRFIPTRAFTKNTKYTVTISTNASDMRGSKLKEPCEFSFITVPEQRRNN